MAKEITGFIKLQVKGGAANPSPPIGPALGSKGVNIMEFCKQFNARTQEQPGKLLPVIINVYNDKSFDFIIKRPPVAAQIMELGKIAKGSGESNRKKVGNITWDQVRKIADRYWMQNQGHRAPTTNFSKFWDENKPANIDTSLLDGLK